MLDGTAPVQENVRESVEAKQELFAAMDELAYPHTILARSISGITPSSVTADRAGQWSQQLGALRPARTKKLRYKTRPCHHSESSAAIVASTAASAANNALISVFCFSKPMRAVSAW